jgi:ABC-type nickel/cobalt efflux system permease component RcnA
LEQLHFLLAVSKYYSHLSRHRNYHQRSASCAVTPACLSLTPAGSMPAGSTQSLTLAPQSMERIIVVPRSTTDNSDLETGVEMVYAAVPLHSLPKDVQERATEAWISTSSSIAAQPPAPSAHRHHHHHRRHHGHGHGHRSASRETTGRIRLDIAPEEGLLPVYTAEPGDEVKA